MDDSTGAGGVIATPSTLPADRVLHSDPHDFAGLYIRHRSSLVLHARRYVNDPRDADEVVQEAFLRLFLALPELETELQALAYSRRTITNLCIDRFRSQARRPQLVALDSIPVDELVDDDPGDPVVRAEDAALVRTALSMLSPLHRDALVKREIEEKSFPVIAEELEIPEETVKHVLFRARRALRKILVGTSLVPGSDAELSGTLGKVARVGPGGIAGLFLIMLLGFGSGPNLQSLPVVGVDLPDLIHATELRQVVGGVVNDVAVVVGVKAKAPVTPDEPAASTDVVPPAEPVSPAPPPDLLPGVAPTAADAAVLPKPAANPAPTALPTAPLPDVALAPTVPVAVQPVVEPTVVPSPKPVAEATSSTPPSAEPTAAASPGQSPTAAAAPTAAPTSPPTTATASAPTKAPVVAPAPAGAQEFSSPRTGGSGSVWKP